MPEVSEPCNGRTNPHAGIMVKRRTIDISEGYVVWAREELELSARRSSRRRGDLD